MIYMMMFSIHQLPCQINTMVNEKKKSVGKGWTNLILFLYNFKYLGIVWKFLVRLIRISFVLDKKILQTVLNLILEFRS
jgi:hypothetical protein